MIPQLNEKDRLRNALTELVNKVPPSINAASIQDVRQWKEWVVKARKAIASNKATLGSLQAIHTNLMQYK